MPDLKLANQPFDLAFHPSEPLVYTSLLTGEVKAFRYSDETGDLFQGWTTRPTKKCMRTLVVQHDGSKVWAGGKAGSIHCIDSLTGKPIEDRLDAHGAPINRICNLFENLFATGDDDGLVKLWDHRQPALIREYPHHWEYISDFLFLEDKKQLVSTSGDGTISVIDVRENSTTPLSQSEDQEDELLSITAVKGSTKFVVGTQLGVVTVWDRTKGWSDSVDRMMGHPASVETLVALNNDVVATGSEDGIIRVMQIHPNKFLGAIATHGDFPIERMKLDRNGKFLGSVSHDDCIKLTDVSELFEDSDGEDDAKSDTTVQAGDEDIEIDAAASSEDENDEDEDGSDDDDVQAEIDEDGDTNMDTSDDDAEDRKERQKQKRKEKQREKKEAKKALLKPKDEEPEEDKGFFADL